MPNRNKSYKIIIRKNGTTHLVLLMTKFYNKEIGYKELEELNSNMSIKIRHTVKRSLLRLATHGYIVFTNPENTRWKITNAGYAFLFDYAENNKTYVKKSSF